MKNLIKFSIFGLLILVGQVTTGSGIVSGPMLGHIELRTAKVWIEVDQNVDATLSVINNSDAKVFSEVICKYEFRYYHFEITNLSPGTNYKYEIQYKTPKSKKKQIVTGEFTTENLWQFRKPAPDVTLLFGSCAYINEPEFDRPGKPYGGDPIIFQTMSKEKAKACFWLGDNWYYREVDYGSKWGLYYRPHHDRAIPEMKDLLKNMSHYAIWDDHDYGPNNSDLSYILKKDAREVFMTYWANPSYGIDNESIFSKVSYSDVDVFLIDDRWYRSNDDLLDTIEGKPNQERTMWGKKQTDWLKSALRQSNATFKIIATGSQVLNEYSIFDCNCHFTYEYNDFLNYLSTEKINGVLFFTGDRHTSSVIKKQIDGFYTLYDITASAFTSGSYPFSGAELNPPNRILGIAQKQNYTRVSVSGTKRNRIMKVEFVDKEGQLINSWSVSENDLSVKNGK